MVYLAEENQNIWSYMVSVRELTGRWTQNAEADTGIDSLKVQSRYTSKLTAQGGSTQSTGKTQKLDN